MYIVQNRIRSTLNPRRHLVSLIFFSILISVILVIKWLKTIEFQSLSRISLRKEQHTLSSSAVNVDVNFTIATEWSPRNPPILDFFIRTWFGDGHWLIYLLRSIERYVPRTLYRNVIISFAASEAAYFESYLPFFSLPIKLVPTDDVNIKNGPNNGNYYSQMYVKFHAYQYSDADYFIHMDSDTMFKEPVNRSDFLDEQNRVFVKRLKFNTLAPSFRIWQRAAEKLLLEPVSYETMTGFPFVYPRDLYEKTIQLIEKRHHKSLLQVAKSVQDFIEFTTLGHYLITYMPETRWVDNDIKSAKVLQSWSWGGFAPNQVAWYECNLRANDKKLCYQYTTTTKRAQLIWKRFWW